LYYLNTGVPKTTDIPTDVKYALGRILSYHGETIGNLYNPGYASALSVHDVRLNADNTIVVLLTGTYVKTKDRCDGPRFRDQLRFTIKQVSDLNSIQILINGAPIGDVISRK
jgi:hypothetical protein